MRLRSSAFCVAEGFRFALRIRQAGIVSFVLPMVTAASGLLLGSAPAAAACDNATPATGQTVTCDTSPPNPDTVGVHAAAGSSNVVVNSGNGAAIAVLRGATNSGIRVESASTITNSGSVSLTGAGSSGLNRGAALLGLLNNNVITNGATGVVSTTGGFNDGMAADGSGNTLINNGTITTTGPNAYGMTASWGQSGGGQPNNSLINNGSVTTNGGTARAASILGQNGTITNTGTLLTNGTGSTAAYMQGNNDHLINSGVIHATGNTAEGVFSNTAGSGFTAAIDNLAGGQIISDQGPAIRTLNGATTITNAGSIVGGSGNALSGGGGTVNFILQTGSQITGLANGGGGNNVVHLQGSGQITNPFTNFQTLNMDGADWTWNGSGTFANTFINSGTFRLQSALTGNVSIAAGTSLLAGNGANASISPFPGGPAITVTNAGLIDLTNGASPTANTLTIVGNYVGANGRLNVQTVLGADGSPSDRLVISNGAASGSTNLGVTNRGGAGGLTATDGILVVQATNGATTTPGTFALDSGFLTAGAYRYYLFRGGVTAGTDNNWYLRSSVPAVPAATPSNPDPVAPVAAANTPALPAAPATGGSPIALYRPEVPLYSAVGVVARQLGLAGLSTFHERQGGEVLLGGENAAHATWGRVFGETTKQQWSGMANPSFDGTFSGLQSGFDVLRWENENGHRDRVGFFAGYGRAAGDVHGFAGGFQGVPVGTLSIDATSVGGYWTHLGPGGWYLDGVAMHTWYSAAPRSFGSLSADAKGTGVAASLEGGYPIPLFATLTLEPQVQVVWQRLSFDDAQDVISSVSYRSSDAWTGRIGFDLKSEMQSRAGLFQPFLKMNLWRNFNGISTVAFGPDAIETNLGATALEVGGGVVAKLSESVGVFAAAGYITDLDRNERQTVRGNAGVRVTW
jgi:type V secretory pathway adhesin AidA